VAGGARGRRAIDRTVEGGGRARTTGGHQLLGEAGRLGMSRLELRGSMEKKGGGRTGTLIMEKGGRVVWGCSPEENGGGVVAAVWKSSGGLDGGGAQDRSGLEGTTTLQESLRADGS
jgi:hypothetical protein